MKNLNKNNNFTDEMELIKAQSQKINNLYYDLENKDKIINDYLIQLKNYSNILEENENLKKNIKKFEEKINLLNSKNNKELLDKENYINNLQNKNISYQNQNNLQNYKTQPINLPNNNPKINYLNNNNLSFNKFFADTLNELNQKNKQIDVLNSKLNKITSKYTIDAMNSYNKDIPNFQNIEEYKINTISSNNTEKKDIILENIMDNNKFEEICRQKEALFKNK